MTNQKDPLSEWQHRALEAERALEQMRIDRDGAASACERLHEEKKELVAQVERLRETLVNARASIGSIDIDAMGVAPATHDRPAYPIRDAVMYEITRRLNETPAQSLERLNGGGDAEEA